MRQKEIEISDFNYIFDKLELECIAEKKFLVTGATGFIGNYLVKLLLYFNEIYVDQSCFIYVLCRNREKLLNKLKEYELNNLVIIEQDVICPILLEKPVDYIVHAASISATKYFNDCPVEVLSANSIGTYQILEYARKYKKFIKKVLFCSSGAVYGEIDKDVDTIKEIDYYKLDFNDIKNFYSEGKRFGEALQRAYWKEYGVPTNNVRISHTYGPGIDLEDGHIYSEIVSAIVNKRDIVLNSSGEATRPFCYISDALIAFIILLQNGKAGESYNMANTSCTYSIYELGQLLLEELQMTDHIKIIRRTSETKSKENKILIDCRKLMGVGWNPKIDVTEGFTKTIAYYKAKDNIL